MSHRYTSRRSGLRSAILTGALLAATACSAAPNDSGNPDPTVAAETTAPVAVDPVIKPAIVTDMRVDPSAVAPFAEADAESAYAEVVEMITQDGFDPTFFAWTPTNTADALAPIYARLTPELATYLRKRAETCRTADAQACRDVMGLAYFDVGSPEWRFSFLPDGTYVTDQRVSQSQAWSGNGQLGIKFTHRADIHMLLNEDRHVVLDAVRDVTYGLVPAPEGSEHDWLIASWTGQLVRQDVKDPITGEKIEQPGAPASSSASGG